MSDQLKVILTSRLTQLFSRYAGAFLVAKVGFDASQGDQLASLVAQAAVAVVLFGIDHLSHYFQKKAQ